MKFLQTDCIIFWNVPQVNLRFMWLFQVKKRVLWLKIKSITIINNYNTTSNRDPVILQYHLL